MRYHVNLLHGEPSSPVRIFANYTWRSINVWPSQAELAVNCTECNSKHRQFVSLRLQKR